jgi:branched-chain amino acid transport system substrate-binding protein
MKKLLFVALVLSFVVGQAHAADTIKIGLMGPMTGSWASEGQEMKQVLELLAEDLKKG